MFYFRCIEIEAPNSDVWQALRNEKPILRRKSRKERGESLSSCVIVPASPTGDKIQRTGEGIDLGEDKKHRRRKGEVKSSFHKLVC